MNSQTTLLPAKSVILEKPISCSNDISKRRSETELLLKVLLQKQTKWKLAKQLNVTWHTVYCWQKGMFSPSADNFKKLQDLAQ